MNSLRKWGWRYWEYFQAIYTGASAMGQSAFSPLHAIPDQSLDNSGLPSNDNNGVAISPHLNPASMDIDTPPQSSNKWCLSTTSAGGLQNNVGAEIEPPSSTVVSSTPASHPRKAVKSVAGSAAAYQEIRKTLVWPESYDQNKSGWHHVIFS